MNERNLSEEEALAGVAASNMHRTNYVRGSLFVFWGALLTLTALAEYALLRWTGSMQVLWTWLVPIICGYIFSAHNARRRSIARTGFDNLLILVWGLPAMVAGSSFVYALTQPDSIVNPVGLTQVLLSLSVMITSEFYRGKGSRQSGSFVGLNMLGLFGLITSFTVTYREPFDAASGTWMLFLAVYGVVLLIFPGLILSHITRKQCSRS
ncbi:hypothetical protein [Alistipes sp.]|uniref:hypothetical protein n=1 Tax=Alistipes sp. TaxID=1872444 RepID=UPI003AF17BE9